MSLDRATVALQYQQLCKTLELEPKQVVLSAGAAMVLLGLRKYTNDLDVALPPEVFEKHKARKGSQQGLLGELVIWDGLTDLHSLPADVQVMDHLGVTIYHPVDLIKEKETMANHPDRKPEKAAQDRKDIQGLKQLLENVFHTRAQLEQAGLQLTKEKV